MLLRALCAVVVALAMLPLRVCAAPLQDYVFVEDDDLRAIEPLLRRPEIAGAQTVHAWKSLEPEPGRYDFSAIERELAFVTARGKSLYVQIQDRFFTPEARNLPDYLLRDPVYGGGLVAQTDRPGEGVPQVQGWVAQQWNAALRTRFQLLLAALAERFDGRIAGINLAETAVDIDTRHDRSGFSCDAYFRATIENLRAARAAFRRSRVVQYVNFWPCEWDDDHRYMSRLFDLALREDIGLGGPDVVPWQRAQMHNAYALFHRHRGRLSTVAMAVQGPTLSYRDPSTGRPFTRAALRGFARDYLGADIVFWSSRAPWLRSMRDRHAAHRAIYPPNRRF